MPGSPRSLQRETGLTKLDLVSYGRRGPHTPLQFTRAQLDQIARTVHGAPEVIIKVSGGGRHASAVKAQLAYIDRHGKLEVYTDEGEALRGSGVAQQLVDDWNVAAGRGQFRPEPRKGEKDRRPKQVHNIVFSMPAGTPPAKLLKATQKFAREKFALRHRYAMVLHTDHGHPHVHVVVKAVSEQGERLVIDKAIFTQWREDFAKYLRELGVAANATPIYLRGKPNVSKRDRLYRAVKSGRSTFLRRKAEQVGRELLRGTFVPEPGKAKLLATRERVVADWKTTALVLRAQGEHALAREVDHYVARLPAVATERELIAHQLLRHVAAQRARDRAAERELSISARTR